MTDSIRITIPGEPVAKGRPRMTRAGIAYTPEKTANWETLAQWECANQYQGEPMDGPLHVTVNAWFKIPKSWPQWRKDAVERGYVWHTIKPDADNLAKCIDAFNGLLWNDDAQVGCLIVHKRYSMNPRVEVVVTKLGGLHSKSKRQKG